MGNKKNSDKWLPADHLRIMAFARSLTPNVSDVHLRQEPKTSNIQEVLSKLDHPVEISNQTLSSWLKGEKRPNVASVNWIKQGLPESASWLKPDIDSSPMRRFLCALDIWGSPVSSPIRKLDAASTGITVSKGLAILARRWASMPVGYEGDVFGGFAIPRLKCHVPHQVPLTVYQASNLLTLMDFMFRCGSYLELSEEEFTEWAIDLASLTLMIGAFLDGISLAERLQSGTTGDYNSLVHRILFLEHGTWPNLESVREELEGFPEFNDSAIAYSERLMLARELLGGNLLSIGSDLSIVKQLSGHIKDRDSIWHVPLGAHGETFAQSDLLRVKRNISPVAPGRYRYEFRYLSDMKRTVLCHDLENGAHAPLPARSDLYDSYPGSFGWGYSGEGPTFLTISILAHHLGHGDFGSEEIDRLLGAYISRFSERLSGPFFLTTELIDKCLNK
ncbi:MAG: DUF6166 domain-containing protein [Sulfuricella sp.]